MPAEGTVGGTAVAHGHGDTHASWQLLGVADVPEVPDVPDDAVVLVEHPDGSTEVGVDCSKLPKQHQGRRRRHLDPSAHLEADAAEAFAVLRQQQAEHFRVTALRQRRIIYYVLLALDAAFFTGSLLAQLARGGVDSLNRQGLSPPSRFKVAWWIDPLGLALEEMAMSLVIDLIGSVAGIKEKTHVLGLFLLLQTMTTVFVCLRGLSLFLLFRLAQLSAAALLRAAMFRYLKLAGPEEERSGWSSGSVWLGLRSMALTMSGFFGILCGLESAADGGGQPGEQQRQGLDQDPQQAPAPARERAAAEHADGAAQAAAQRGAAAPQGQLAPAALAAVAPQGAAGVQSGASVPSGASAGIMGWHFGGSGAASAAQHPAHPALAPATALAAGDAGDGGGPRTRTGTVAGPRAGAAALQQRDSVPAAPPAESAATPGRPSTSAFPLLGGQEQLAAGVGLPRQGLGSGPGAAPGSGPVPGQAPGRAPGAPRVSECAAQALNPATLASSQGGQSSQPQGAHALGTLTAPAPGAATAAAVCARAAAPAAASSGAPLAVAPTGSIPAGLGGRSLGGQGAGPAALLPPPGPAPQQQQQQQQQQELQFQHQLQWQRQQEQLQQWRQLQGLQQQWQLQARLQQLQLAYQYQQQQQHSYYQQQQQQRQLQGPQASPPAGGVASGPGPCTDPSQAGYSGSLVPATSTAGAGSVAPGAQALDQAVGSPGAHDAPGRAGNQALTQQQLPQQHSSASSALAVALPSQTPRLDGTAPRPSGAVGFAPAYGGRPLPAMAAASSGPPPATAAAPPVTAAAQAARPAERPTGLLPSLLRRLGFASRRPPYRAPGPAAQAHTAGSLGLHIASSSPQQQQTAEARGGASVEPWQVASPPLHQTWQWQQPSQQQLHAAPGAAWPHQREQALLAGRDHRPQQHCDPPPRAREVPSTFPAAPGVALRYNPIFGAATGADGGGTGGGSTGSALAAGAGLALPPSRSPSAGVVPQAGSAAATGQPGAAAAPPGALSRPNRATGGVSEAPAVGYAAPHQRRTAVAQPSDSEVRTGAAAAPAPLAGRAPLHQQPQGTGPAVEPAAATAGVAPAAGAALPGGPALSAAVQAALREARQLQQRAQERRNPHLQQQQLPPQQQPPPPQQQPHTPTALVPAALTASPSTSAAMTQPPAGRSSAAEAESGVAAAARAAAMPFSRAAKSAARQPSAPLPAGEGGGSACASDAMPPPPRQARLPSAPPQAAVSAATPAPLATKVREQRKDTEEAEARRRRLSSHPVAPPVAAAVEEWVAGSTAAAYRAEEEVAAASNGGNAYAGPTAGRAATSPGRPRFSGVPTSELTGAGPDGGMAAEGSLVGGAGSSTGGVPSLEPHWLLPHRHELQGAWRGDRPQLVPSHAAVALQAAARSRGGVAASNSPLRVSAAAVLGQLSPERK